MHFILLLEIKDITDLNDLIKIMKDDNYKENEDDQYQLYIPLIETYKNLKFLNNIYSKLIEIDDVNLFKFLKIASVPLLKIDKKDNYLRMADTAGLTINKKDLKEIDSKRQIGYLKNNQVKEFNEYRKKNPILIHLPYAYLPYQKLDGGLNLSDSFLFKANLTQTDLTEADLTGSHLTEADLTSANLTSANLTSANLSRTTLSKTYLTSANLTSAKLEYSIIINNIFSENTVVSNADFKNAIIDDHEFLEHLYENNAKNIPKEKINNKQELKLQLESRRLNHSLVKELLNLSKLFLT
jgi:uncharacterized protein YjbI with pentapeptide repeats